jgi:hypothetical protein
MWNADHGYNHVTSYWLLDLTVLQCCGSAVEGSTLNYGPSPDVGYVATS